ncbi:heterokaryon incompatibility protein-domain-containing protein [Colletotrichum phormii]|uniref:Heterokaryon incompatibility protein-domain-containing protein n=1 Tax=Colletotrichum phormii TaxID=359342 RepID=A0AAI9ZD33_9PEZI|nr:heterokaryon incompatibility protein-domain-containing protein [Colletotrichum phormii]KAK1622309.1 heterokaryon incompatibility protein-domain-containing protein [Colletotrichum phormii]
MFNHLHGRNVGRLKDCTFCSDGSNPVSNSFLCQGCQPWNDFFHVVFCYYASQEVDVSAFDSDFNKSDSGFYGFQSLNFRSLRSTADNPECMICSFIGSELSTVAGADGDTKFAICGLFPSRRTDPSSRTLISNRVHETSPFAESCALAICVSGLTTPAGNKTNSGYQPVVLEISLKYGTKDGSQLESAELWDRRYINVSLLRSWFSGCHKYHGSKCNEPLTESKLPGGLRVIDTKRRRIIEPKTQAPFVALSYTWRLATASADRDLHLTTLNAEKLKRTDALLPDLLPEVVVDAIHLCRNMGQRYLWVDRLCILQDDEDLKMAQINAMNDIYQLAEFTIIAAANGVGAGLPGLTTRPNISTHKNHCWQFIKHVPRAVEGTISNGNSSMDHAVVGIAPLSENQVISSSEWNSRAWTFQEKLLSRRHVFFSNGHVYFSCFHEGSELHRYPDIRHYRPQEYPQADDAMETKDYGGRGFEKGLRSDEYSNDGVLGFYPLLVDQYTKRTLGRREDVLSAFAGVGNVVAARAKTQMLLGLPERYLAHSLLWSFCSPLEITYRTAEGLRLPSWTWATRKGSVIYQRSLGGRIDGDWLDPMYQIHFGHLISFFYCDPVSTGSSRLRSVSEGKVWFPEDRIDDSVHPEDLQRDLEAFFQPKAELVRAVEYKYPQQQASWSRVIELWAQSPHSPMEARHHIDIDGKTKARAEEHPHSLVFNTTVARVRIGSYLRGDDEGIQLTIYGNDGAKIGTSAPMHRHWALKCLSMGTSHYMVVIAAGLKFPGTWEHNTIFSESQGFGFYVLITTRTSGLYSRLGVGFVSLDGWASVEPSWEPVVLV